MKIAVHRVHLQTMRFHIIIFGVIEKVDLMSVLAQFATIVSAQGARPDNSIFQIHLFPVFLAANIQLLFHSCLSSLGHSIQKGTPQTRGPFFIVKNFSLTYLAIAGWFDSFFASFFASLPNTIKAVGEATKTEE